MKKIYFSFIAFFALTILILTQSNTSNSSSNIPLAGKTGAPGETTCANTGCHTGPTPTGNIVINFSGGDFYSANGQYTIAIAVNEVAEKYGFEITALDNGNNLAGIPLPQVGSTTTIAPTSGAVGSRKYVSHKGAGASSTWVIDYTAPSLNVGDITFYVAANAADGNMAKTGDKILTATKTISFNTSAPSITTNTLFAVQNPVTYKINITINESNSDFVRVQLFDIAGRFVADL